MASLTSTADFVAALQQHQLLEPAQLKEVEEMQTRMEDPAALAAAVVERGWLTPYQADQVLKNHGGDLVFGPYRILELLGEGGMGQVFKALHRRLYRVVALKVIRQDRLSRDPEVVKRFQREAQAAAQLSHPNVVLIYDADQVDQKHFLTMEYVEGVDLTQLVKERGPLPVEQACEFIRQAALGLHHAHERGLIHRDIKPSNLLVTRPASRSYLQAVASGGPEAAPTEGGPCVVKVLDMGLARLNTPSSSSNPGTSFHTEAGVVMGTPDFIAPEQARNPRGVDHRADLYSLGCTLYFLLTGRPPFVEGSAIEKMLSHQMDEPEPIDELRPDVPAYVGAILRRLMAKRPADRFNSAQEVAEALAALTTPTSSPSVALPAQAPDPTNEDQSTAVVRVTPLQQQDSQSHVKGTLPELVPVQLREQVLANESGRAVSEPAAKEDPDASKRIALLRGHRSWVLSAAFSPDRNLLATGGVDGNVHVWGFSSSLPKDQVVSHPHNSEVHAVAFGPDNRHFASASGALDGTIVLWEASATGVECRKRLTGHQSPVEVLAFTPDGKVLASGGADCIVRLWEAAGTDVRERKSLKGHLGTIQTITVSPDSRLIISGGQDGTVRVWNLTKWGSPEQAVLPGHYGNVTALACSPDSKMVASGGSDAAILLWEIEASDNTRPRAVLEGNVSTVRLLLFLPGENKLVSVSDRGRAILWDLTTTKPEREWSAPGMMIGCVALTFDGRYLAVGKNDGTIAVFRQYPKRS